MLLNNNHTISLDGIYLFDTLTDKQRERMRHCTRLVSLRNGEHLFEQGQAADHFYLVKSGQMTLKRLSPDGGEKVIEIIRPGQTFAEATMFTGNPHYPVSAIAVGPSKILKFSKSDYLSILKDSTEGCLRLIASMSTRLHHMVNEIDHLTMWTGTSRIINFLLYQLPEDASGSVEVKLSTPKNLIASLLSIKPETFSRTLHELSDKGMITVNKRLIGIRNVEELREYGNLLNSMNNN